MVLKKAKMLNQDPQDNTTIHKEHNKTQYNTGKGRLDETRQGKTTHHINIT
jgi:hypothetical protein